MKFFEKIKRLMITWEGILTVPAITLLMVFAFKTIAELNPYVGVYPEQYLQEILYKIAVLVIGSNVVQLGIYINVMLFYNIKLSDIKIWFQELENGQKLWVCVCFYALYYLVYALVRL